MTTAQCFMEIVQPADVLRTMADIETGRDELEPHQRLRAKIASEMTLGELRDAAVYSEDQRARSSAVAELERRVRDDAYADAHRMASRARP